MRGVLNFRLGKIFKVSLKKGLLFGVDQRRIEQLQLRGRNGGKVPLNEIAHARIVPGPIPANETVSTFDQIEQLFDPVEHALDLNSLFIKNIEGYVFTDPRLNHLTHVFLGGTHIRSLPPQLFDLPELEFLNIQNTPLAHDPILGWAAFKREQLARRAAAGLPPLRIRD